MTAEIHEFDPPAMGWSPKPGDTYQTVNTPFGPDLHTYETFVVVDDRCHERVDVFTVPTRLIVDNRDVARERIRQGREKAIRILRQTR